MEWDDSKENQETEVNFDLVKTDIQEARAYVQKARDNFGMLAGVQFDRETDKQLKSIAGTILVNVLNAERVLIVNSLSSHVAKELRNQFRDDIVGFIEQDAEIRIITDNASREMRNLANVEVVEVLKNKKVQLDEAERLLKSGEILEEDSELYTKSIRDASSAILKEKFDKVNIISKNYSERFKDALKRYKEIELDSGSKI